MRRLSLVTGGTRGIGAAVALRLAAEGHDLALGYHRDTEAAEATAAKVRAHGVACRTVQADLNLTAAILVARRAVQVLDRGGVLVNVSSSAATLGAPHEYVHYAAAKEGVGALTHGLAQEVAPRGIRVVGVAPGIVRTGIHADAGDPGRLERVGPRVPIGRAGKPEEIAEAVAWLMSDAYPYATGATLRVAGGR